MKVAVLSRFLLLLFDSRDRRFCFRLLRGFFNDVFLFAFAFNCIFALILITSVDTININNKYVIVDARILCRILTFPV